MSGQDVGLLRNDKPLKMLSRITKRPSVDIEFQDLVYTVTDGAISSGQRQILKSISGKFCSGNLTAILGPSGAGKSTLLNILAGYVSVGVTGSIKVNDRPRHMKLFHKLSSYILQEDLMQPRLTVREATLVATQLKLGAEIGHDEKIGVMNEVLSLLGLEKCLETKTEYLSGGQRKRLSIALELVSNPPIIFLDEPTTYSLRQKKMKQIWNKAEFGRHTKNTKFCSGLDNYAIKKCIDLLQKLTKQGRTVICTIHQPPASIFEQFDQVYFIAGGCCVYNGNPFQVVPFLASSGFICPQTYTPADYIIEIIQANSDYVTTLVSASQNGKKLMQRKPKQDELAQYCLNEDAICCVYGETTHQIGPKNDYSYPTTFWEQFRILLGRMILQMRRNKSMLLIQFFHHLASAALIGGIFFGIGNDAALMISNFKYCISVVVFFMYTHVMAPVLLFPFEVKLLKREFFNHWYDLKAYYCALTVATLPLLLLLGFMFSLIVYFMTDQPWEMDRFVLFTCMALMIAMTSQGLGFSIGSLFSTTNGSVVGPSVLAPLLALAVYGMGYKSDHIVQFMKVLMSMSYIRYGIVGFCTAVYEDRGHLQCFDELYCHYKDPKLLMRDMGMADTKYRDQIVVMVAFGILFRMTAFLALRYKLTSEFSNKIVNYATKILRHK